jgi:hypothetical protein
MNLSGLKIFSFLRNIPSFRVSPRKGISNFPFFFSYIPCLSTFPTFIPISLLGNYIRSLQTTFVTPSLAILSFTGTSIAVSLIYPQTQASFGTYFQDTEANNNRLDKCPSIKSVLSSFKNASYLS